MKDLNGPLNVFFKKKNKKTSKEIKLKILVTGHAGFIGFHLAKRLLERGDDVVGFDVVNDYYDPRLKEARLELLQKKADELGSDYVSIRKNMANQDSS